MAAARWNSCDSRGDPPQRLKTPEIVPTIRKSNTHYSKMNIRVPKGLLHLEMIKKPKVLKSLILLLRKTLFLLNKRRKKARTPN